MSTINLMGVLSWVCSGVILLFQSITSIMGNATDWKNHALINFMSPEQEQWLDTLSPAFLLKAADTIVTAPLYILLLIIGVAFFVLGYFFQD